MVKVTAGVTQGLPSKHEALSSNPSTEKKKFKRQRKAEELFLDQRRLKSRVGWV
jgi:hypothetical protein